MCALADGRIGWRIETGLTELTDGGDARLPISLKSTREA